MSEPSLFPTGRRTVHVPSSSGAAPGAAHSAGITDATSTGMTPIIDDELHAQAESILEYSRTAAPQFVQAAQLAEASIASELDRLDKEARTQLRSRTEEKAVLRDTRLAELDIAKQQRMDELAAQAATSVSQLASATMTSQWCAHRDLMGASRAPSSHCRVGTVGPDADSLPALLPLLNQGGWFLTGDTNASLELIKSTLARIVDEVPMGNLEIIVFDPKLGGRLGQFSPLRATRPASFPPPISEPQEFATTLHRVVANTAENAEKMSTLGAANLAELWPLTGSPEGNYSIVVVLGYPFAVDEAVHATLSRLAETGAARGTTLLVQNDASVPVTKEVQASTLPLHLTTLTLDSGKISVPSHHPGLSITADPPISRAVVDDVIERAARRMSESQNHTIPLAELITTEDDWSESSLDGLIATVGRTGNKPTTLALRSENPPHPNALVGGAVGQGKSNLLLDIVYSLAARYSPDELELLLLDFKLGLEFKRFDADSNGENWLPHVRVLGLESNRAFGLAVLHHVVAELTRRSDAFKAKNCNSITEYRRNTGLPMSRMLLIIDEFQMLFDGDDGLTEDSVQALEQLAKQGRAFGIHLLLSSQTVSGIGGLRIKGDAIFAQFPVRISLKNTSDESQAIFAFQNTAAAQLTHRGEFIINRNYGLDPENSNERGIAAFAEPEFVKGLQTKLWQRTTTPQRPLVFLGNSAAEWPDARVQSLSHNHAVGELAPWLGRPIAVTDSPITVELQRDTDQAVAIIGSGEEETASTLTSLLLTGVLGSAPGVHIIILDGTGRATSTDGWLSVIAEVLERRGGTLTIVPATDVAHYLLTKSKGLTSAAEAPPIFIVGLSLQRITNLHEEAPLEEGEVSFDPETAAKVLQDISTRGATRGVFLIGCWSSVRSLRADLDYGAEGIGTYVVSKISREELQDLAGPHVSQPEGSPRSMVISRSTDRTPITAVPFRIPSSDDARRWCES